MRNPKPRKARVNKIGPQTVACVLAANRALELQQSFRGSAFLHQVSAWLR